MFESWYLNDLMNKNVREIWPLTDNYLIKLIKNILDRTGMSDDLRKPVSIPSIIKKYGYSDKAFNALKWVLERLKFSGFMVLDETGNEPLYHFSDNEIKYDEVEIYNYCVAQEPESSHTFLMLKLMADNYEDYLKGNKTGVEIIYSPENIHIINEYYEKSLFYNANNILGAKALNYEVDQRNNPHILELGGGLGGGTKQFISQRKAEGKMLNSFTYHFTDVANKMIRGIKKTIDSLTGDLSNYEFSKFDFNKPLTEVGVEENKYDIIWAVNAIHVAYDLKFTLSELYKVLKPGGVILISETVRPSAGPMIQHEFVISTLDDYWNVKLDNDWRPNFGFMKWTNWIKALDAAGFDVSETVPDMKFVESEFNNCYTAVIKGIKK